MATQPYQSFGAGLLVQARVLGALCLRELHTRYGRDNIGYLWLIGEPMILATVITSVHIIQPQTHYGSDIAPAPFATIGYTIYIIFRGVFNRAEIAVENNKSLLYHRNVTIFDVILVTAILETVGCFLTMAVLLTIATMFGYASFPARPLHLLVAVGLMAWFSLGAGMAATALTYGRETLARQLHVITYLSIPISGAFIVMAWLPPSFRDVFQWIPMPLIFEEARYGQFESALPDYVAPGYVAAWCAGLTFVGLLLIRRLRQRIHVN